MNYVNIRHHNALLLVLPYHVTSDFVLLGRIYVSGIPTQVSLLVRRTGVLRSLVVCGVAGELLVVVTVLSKSVKRN